MRAGWICVGIFLAASWAAGAQQSAAVAPYDVVSIRPHKLGTQMKFSQGSSNGFRFPGFTVQGMVKMAYDLALDSQVENMPRWANTERYDFEAKMVDEEKIAAKKHEPRALERQRIRMILEDRCRLKAHTETRVETVYELVLAKGGLKLKGVPATNFTSSNSAEGKLEEHGALMSGLAYMLSRELLQLVVDKTGLGNKQYDLTLTWTPESRAQAGEAGPTLFTALEEQLGLKLVATKAPVEVVVVDHIEKPSEN
jgi:uncharacterized protein (TIGR03435 family)